MTRGARTALGSALVLVAACRDTPRPHWAAAPRFDVEVAWMGTGAELVVPVHNHTDQPTTVVVESVSCGCITPLARSCVVPPHGEGALRFRVKPLVLVPTQNRITLQSQDPAHRQDVQVTTTARFGVHESRSEVALADALDGTPRPITEVLVSVPTAAGIPSLQGTCAPDDGVLEFVLDTAQMRRQDKGATVWAVPVFAVGRKDSPRMARECKVQAHWHDGAGSAACVVVAAVAMDKR